jgi:chromosomal replication initiation ATPase DnaA
MDSLQPRTVALRDIMPLVCCAYAVTPVDIMSQRRGRDVSVARQCLYWLARRHTLHSYPTIGQVLRRDHSTVLTGQRKHAARMQSDPKAARITSEIEAKICEVSA